jgi:hypothetical protein
MNGLITLGIPFSELTQLLTSGLSLGSAPPPDEPSDSGGGLNLDVPQVVVDDESAPFTSVAFAIPSGATTISWQCLGTVADVDLEGSLDFTHFSAIDNADAAEVNTIQAGPTSLRITINDGTDVTVIVTAKREKL